MDEGPTIERVLVCAGESSGVCGGTGVLMVMHNVSDALRVSTNHVTDWSTFFKQIVEDFLLPLPRMRLCTLICGQAVLTCV